MSRSVSHSKFWDPIVAHLIAGGLALAFAWFISKTQYVTSGVQFVSPLAIVLIVHLAWLAMRREIGVGFAAVVFRRMFVTAMGIITFTMLCALFAPMPVEAQSSQDSGALFSFLYLFACLAVLALVVGAAALIIYVFWLGLRAVYDAIKGPPKGPAGSRLYDASATVLALLVRGTASLEGISPGLTFAAADGASATVIVAAPPDRVWQAVGRATSPDVPLPAMLRSIPQPVAIVLDEGAGLGARRVVRFKGREGEGDLVLEVIRRTDTEAIFEAVSDSSPIAMWVRHRSLSFRIEPLGSGSRLTVGWQYDRLLSPAWFFRPYIRVASFLAVGVLAHDTKQRSEVR